MATKKKKQTDQEMLLKMRKHMEELEKQNRALADIVWGYQQIISDCLIDVVGLPYWFRQEMDEHFGEQK